jgi:hypothetical protein
MTSHTAAPDRPAPPTPESASSVLVASKDDGLVLSPDEQSNESDESPVPTDSPGEAEFKEGGYGW